MEKETKKFIKVLRKISSNELDFSGIIDIIKRDNINIKLSRISQRIGGFTVYNQIHINEWFDSKKMLFFVILHEIAHYKRLSKYSLDELIIMHKNLFEKKDFEIILTEERIADKYASIIGSYLTNYNFTYHKQKLYEQDDINHYINNIQFIFDIGDSDYLTHIEKIKKIILYE